MRLRRLNHTVEGVFFCCFVVIAYTAAALLYAYLLAVSRGLI